MKLNLFLLLALIIACFSIPKLNYGQSSTGILNVNIFPADALILLDGDTISNGAHTVSLGSHLVEAWAPKMKLYSVSVTVEAGKQSYTNYTLRYSDSYRTAYNEYRSK